MQIKEIPLNQIVPNPEQPRKEFDFKKLQSLAQSIKKTGLISPITVEATDKPDLFILEDGERRWRAHRMLGLTKIKAVVKPARKNGDKALRLQNALVANLQRADLNPVEEGVAYLRLREELGWPVIKISRTTGVAQATIENRLALTRLQPEIQQLIIEKRLPRDMRAVEAFFSVANVKARVKLAHALASRQASVKSIVNACIRLNEQLAGSNGATGLDPTVAPAIHYGQKKAGKRKSPIWNQLMEKQSVPSWEIVKAAAEAACARCPWHNQPSAEICGQCPAVDLVASMVRRSSAHKA